MSQLILVRHGQASFLADDYDRLSEKGRRQCERLGEYWGSTQPNGFSLVAHGPARRHAESGECAAAAFGGGGARWPAPLLFPEFDEYQAFELMRAALPGLVEKEACVRDLDREFRTQTDPVSKARAFERIFQYVTRAWVRGRLDAAGVEPWPEFCARVRRGLHRMVETAGRSARVVVFTSGGPIAVVAGLALGLSAETILELSWESWNASYSEFRFSGGRLSLNSFNEHPHLQTGSLLTYR